MIRVAILLGGTSQEHEISLKTGNFVFNTLDRKKYSVTPVLITKSGKWIFPKTNVSKIPSYKTIEEYSKNFETDFKNLCNGEVNSPPHKIKNFDIIFIALHGGDGEDGTIQSILDELKLKYTGSGVKASQLAMNKELANKEFYFKGFNVAPFFNIKRENFIKDQNSVLKNLELNYPVFAKPTFGGSSVGAGKAIDAKELISRLDTIFKTDQNALVQELITGVEVSCGVIEFFNNGKFIPRPLYPTETIPKGEFFDFNSKYVVGGSEEITPARLEAKLLEDVRSQALKAHISIGCRGYSRTDFIISDGVPFILELNTLPGMTETSFIPQQIAYENLQMSYIFDTLIENGLAR
ncbi:MAG: D-alanine--D-alanine ligase [Leptospiraceae bacterium]|nr:D-alanine--D-alanine ligase [Leptospiraceae bacterium]